MKFSYICSVVVFFFKLKNASIFIFFSSFQGGLEGEFYYIKDHKIPRIKVTREMIDAALEQIGCRIVCWQELPRSLRPLSLPIDYKAMYFCVAQKYF